MNLKELSQILGLSPTTVSRALNGYPEVSETTRRRVEAAAAQHNYRPDARARSLATGRSKVIGYVLPHSKQHEIVNPIFGDFFAGASQTYAQHGYDTMISLVDDEDEEQVYRDLLSRGAVDGVIMQAPRVNDARIALLNQLRIPFVVHGRSGEGLSYSCVDVGNKRAFERATQFLIDLGHRRIALVNGNEDMEFARRRRDGYLAALQQHAIAVDPNLMHSDEMTEIYGHHCAGDMLNSAAAPTAFLVSSLITAIGVRRAVEERGLTIGRDISVVIYDDDLSYLKNGQDIPIFTATRSSVREAGRHCAEMLIDLINNPGQPPRQHIMETELLVGGSTGPAILPDLQNKARK